LAYVSGTYKWDFDSWTANCNGLVNFLILLSERFSPKYCIFLSGDVHYGFTLRTRVTLYQNKNGKVLKGNTEEFDQKHCISIPIIQLTSSPLKSTGLISRLLVSKIIRIIHNLFLPQQNIRVGVKNTYIKNIIKNFFLNKGNANMEIFPDWIESQILVEL
jgi:hypothetical protein